MNKLTVGKRIILGFSSLIILSILLGSGAIFSMLHVSEGAHTLEEECIPEVTVSTEIERNLLLAMFENRGFGFTEKESYYDSGQEYFGHVMENLDEARELAETENLPTLKKREALIREGVTEYVHSVETSKENVKELVAYREAMDHSANEFMEKTKRMLSIQEDQLDEEVTDFLLEVVYAKDILSLGDDARVASVKFRDTGDTAFEEQSFSSIQGVLDNLSELEGFTTDPHDLELISIVTEISEDYKSKIENYVKERSEGSFAVSESLDNAFEEMEVSAEAFLYEADNFLNEHIGSLESELSNRNNKIKWVNALINLGNIAMLDSNKAQANRDPEIMREGIRCIEEMHEYHEKLGSICDDPEEAAILKEIDEADHLFKAAMEGFLVTYSNMQELNSKRLEIANMALAEARGQAEEGHDEIVEIADDTVANMVSAVSLIFIGMLIATGIGVALAYFITRSINKPLGRAIDGLSAGANETNGASSQVSSASQSLAEGASEQAASLEETSSSMEEMTSMVARNLEVAKKTNEQAKNARTAADSGVRSMGELRERADAVSDSAQEMESAMQAIKQSSNSISKIIKTIDEIAFQTNILALNAAVEAARAGEAGAGFAVVADEVRSLAKRAAEAAQETASMIEDSMERSDRGVRVNETVGRNLKDVLEKASEVENGLKSISSVVSGVNEAMDELEASVKEQQDGISQINTAVSQVNEVTQANAASAEEAASAAEQMNAQSINLLDIVATLDEMVTGNQVNEGARKKPLSRPSTNGYANSGRVESKSIRRVSPSHPDGNAHGSASVRENGRSSRIEKTFSLPGDFE